MNIFKLFSVDKKLFDNIPYWGRKGNYHFYFAAGQTDPEALADLLIPPAGEPDLVFPTRRRRKVFAAHTAAGQEVLVKQFFLWRHKRDCFAVKDFAYREIMAQLKFAAAPYLMPGIYGYYEKRICGFPVECGIIMQYLKDFRKLDVMEYECVPGIIIALYERGLYHGDLGVRNILLHNSSGEIALIDFDLAENVPENSLHYLGRMAGGFLYSANFKAPEKVDMAYRMDFISKLYDALPSGTRENIPFDEFKEPLLQLTEIFPWGKEAAEILQKAEIFRLPPL